MKRTSASLKLIARQQLSGNYGTPMAGILLLGLCSFLPSFFISANNKEHRYAMRRNQHHVLPAWFVQQEVQDRL